MVANKVDTLTGWEEIKCASRCADLRNQYRPLHDFFLFLPRSLSLVLAFSVFSWLETNKAMPLKSCWVWVIHKVVHI